MKESKIAGFKNVNFGADFDGGVLVSLTLIPDTAEQDGTLRMSPDEVGELTAWLAGLIGIQPQTGSGYGPVQAPGPSPDALRGWVVTAETGKISDADSVKNRVALDKALRADGMALEDRSSQIQPITVQFSAGGVKK